MGAAVILNFMEGGCAAEEWIDQVYDSLPPKCRRVCFAALPESDWRAGFKRCLAIASHIGIASNEDCSPMGAGWIMASGPRSRFGTAHFVMGGSIADGLEAGRLFLSHAAGRYSALAAMIPLKNFGAMRFAGRLGFKRAADLPRACWRERLGRCESAALMLINLEDAYGSAIL